MGDTQSKEEDCDCQDPPEIKVPDLADLKKTYDAAKKAHDEAKATLDKHNKTLANNVKNGCGAPCTYENPMGFWKEYMAASKSWVAARMALYDAEFAYEKGRIDKDTAEKIEKLCGENKGGDS